MNYFYSYLNDFSEFDLNLENKLTLFDKEIFQYILSEFENQDTEVIKIKTDNLRSTFDFKNENILDCFNKLMRKKIRYSFKTSDDTNVKGAFHPLVSYSVIGEYIYITLAKEVQYSFEKNNLFNYINLVSILKFKKIHSLIIYLKLLNSFSIEQYNAEFTLSLPDLKELLEVGHSYDRFYDLEKKVLNPIIDDINNYTNFQFEYSKIKKSEGRSSKIIAIKFTCVNEVIKELRESANQILLQIKDKVKDFDLMQNVIINYLRDYNYKYVMNNAKFSLKNHKKHSFEKHFVEALESNLYGQKNNVDMKKIEVEREIHTINDLYNEINIIAKQLKLIDIIYNQNFHYFLYRNFYRLRDKEIYQCKYTEGTLVLKFEVIYNKNSKSKIIIEKNK